jgi:hypothetical protein
MRQVLYACLLVGGSSLSTACADDFVLLPASDPRTCSVEGRVETQVYPRSVGRKIAMLHPGSRLTTTTEMNNISILLPPVFESPGPRYGNFLACRLRVRIDDLPRQELMLAAARSETILAENLPPGKHTVTVEPVDGFAVVEAFRFAKSPMAGVAGTIVSANDSELLTDVRADLFQGERLVRTEYVRSPRSGGFEILGMQAGEYRLRIRAAGWKDATTANGRVLGPWAEVAQLAGVRTLLVADEVNAAYVSGALSDLRIPYVVSRGNHTMPRWSDF